MPPLDLKDVLGAAYKLNDWLNFYWNFYVVFTGVVIGWVFNSKGWSTAQRVVVTLFYLGFVGVSLGALYSTYISLGAATTRLTQLLPTSDILAQALISQLEKSNLKLGLALHILGDALVIGCIWRFTRKPPESNPQATSTSVRP